MVVPAELVVIKVPKACVLPKGIVNSELPTFPTSGLDENKLILTCELGSIAGCPSES